VPAANRDIEMAFRGKRKRRWYAPLNSLHISQAS